MAFCARECKVMWHKTHSAHVYLTVGLLRDAEHDLLVTHKLFLLNKILIKHDEVAVILECTVTSCCIFVLSFSRLRRTWKSHQLLVYQNHPQLCRRILSTTFSFHLALMWRLIWTKWLGHRIFSRNTFHESGMTRLWLKMTTTVFHEQHLLGCRQSRFTSGWCSLYIPRLTYQTLRWVIPSVGLLPGCRRPRHSVARISTSAAAARWIATSITMRVLPVCLTEHRQCHVTGCFTALRSRSPTCCQSTQRVSRTRKCGTTAGLVLSRSQAVSHGVLHLNVFVAAHVSHSTAHSQTFQLPWLTPSKIFFVFSRICYCPVTATG